jgi:alkylated DNA repair dioxygenase AlkB
LRGSAELSFFLDSEAAHTLSEPLVRGDGDVVLRRGWLATERADELLASIRRTTCWTQERRKMYDRYVDVPREQAWFGDEEPATRPMSPELAAVRLDLEALTGVRFPYVLLNRYRNGRDARPIALRAQVEGPRDAERQRCDYGRDSVAWHNDREVAGLAAPVIASLTLGATRAFDLRPKGDRSRIVSVDLDHGDLIVMRGETQRNYEHRIAKDARIAGERINLTFRQRPDS